MKRVWIIINIIIWNVTTFHTILEWLTGMRQVMGIDVVSDKVVSFEWMTEEEFNERVINAQPFRSTE